ncbi:LAQU0S11e00166g1_1 [Lachancea quebecensis]|uniref:LAQU0S11e00166g1_1 n=1 Tax=Lachancea quebecensis TaxID=1654605 RepID=A0A0P1KWC5_9SACH|nr:LAQU0S11e00166g1_1 [Lachancea quebecensis]
MSSKKIIGGAAMVAAGYALYEYQVQRQQRHLNTGALTQAPHKDAHLFEQKGSEAGSKLDQATNQARDQVAGWAHEADRKVSSTMAEVERAKAKSSKWIGDQLGEAQEAVTDRRDKYLERSGELNAIVEETNERKREGQNRISRMVTDARDTISADIRNIKEGVSEDASSIKEALVGAKKGTQETADSLKRQASDVESDLKNKAGNARDTAVEAKESIFNWGFSKAEKAKAVAIQEYDQANKHFNELREKYNSEKGLFSGGDQELKKQVDEASKKLEEYKKKLEDASSRYAKYTNDNINELSDKLEQEDRKLRKKGFFQWLRGDASGSDKSKTHDVDEVAAKSVVGWGETAEALAREELDELVRNKKIGRSEAQRRLDELKKIKDEGWFTYKGRNDEALAKRAAKALEGWGETASELAHEEYEEARRKTSNFNAPKSISDAVDTAKEKLDAAKKQLDDSASGLWSSGKEKTEDLRQKAQKEYEQAEKDYSSSLQSLSEWSEKAKGKFWSGADTALGATKSTADTLHAKAKEGLNTAQEYAKEKKE